MSAQRAEEPTCRADCEPCPRTDERTKQSCVGLTEQSKGFIRSYLLQHGTLRVEQLLQESGDGCAGDVDMRDWKPMDV